MKIFCLHVSENSIRGHPFKTSANSYSFLIFYSSVTLCIVNFCSKEQFASNWLVTVCSLTHFTPQHTLPTGIFFSLEHFAPQPPLLPRTLFSSAQFASQHTLLLSPLYSLAHFAPWNTLLPGIFWSKRLHLKW